MTTLLITAIIIGLFGYGLWRTRNAAPVGAPEDRDAARVHADLAAAGGRPAHEYLARIPVQERRRFSTRSTLASSCPS